jgi:hypothetical protein
LERGARRVEGEEEEGGREGGREENGRTRTGRRINCGWTEEEWMVGQERAERRVDRGGSERGGWMVGRNRREEDRKTEWIRNEEDGWEDPNEQRMEWKRRSDGGTSRRMGW